ncbi:B-cell receptor CD22 [Anabarilius grahami]|uniref:B-cell receptor CD22 n=1 Tax=Anabarilius grahami TaxID=495550 RepID=A0A3N0XD18_ANAGA|nr:B-cell receptor CD22 [Anabarilius grahami]
MFPEGILLLLFVIHTGSFIGLSDIQIKVNKETETTKEGSSVTIPCVYLYKEDNLKLLWFKDPKYDVTTQLFNGIIVYSNTDERPTSPEYKVNRVEYITDITSNMEKGKWIQCDLRITDLKTTDSGNYSFRFLGSKKNKYMSTAMNLTVTENPCKVHIEPPEIKNPLKESEEFTVNCSTFASCSDHPEWLIYKGQGHEWMSSLTDMIIETEKEKDGRTVTKLKLNVTWKDDKRILSCRPGQDQNSGQIRNITLSVEYAPKETNAKVSSEDVKEGSSVTLSCTSRGRPNVTFLWFKKERIEKSQNSDLELNNVKPEDSGNYYCEAKNKYGEMESNIITIDVKYGPKDVTVKPLVRVEDLKEGDKLELECSVKESNPAVKQFTWYNNNTEIQQQTNKILTISEITADDRGFYHCRADNDINSKKSNEILVSVKYSPRNIDIQGKRSVKVNSGLSLTCSADANPKPVQYTWKHTPGLSYFPLSSPTGQLNINSVTIQHAGQYTCDVNNTIGTRSHTINVDVLYPPSNLSLIMKSEVREFEVFSIICTVQSFPASKLTVTGPRYDLINIQNNRRNITESKNMLTVYLNVTESDAGMYICKAENSEGNLENHQKELTVLHAPKNVTVSSEGEQTFGRELTLTCGARSKPVSSYEWKKSFNGQLKTVGHEQKLHFRSLSISDSGQFVCIAKNSIGETRSQSVDIRVKYTPNINIVHNQTKGNWELPVYLSCNADAYPPAFLYKWYRKEDNTTVLSDQQNFTVQPQNPGTYYCTAANSIGESRSKHFKLFLSDPVKVLYQIILPIILLLILIAVAIFLIRRTINKARLDQQSGADYPLCFFPVFLSRSSTGSQNNTRENLSMEDIPDPVHGSVNQSHPTPHSQDPTQAQDLNPRTKSNIHTVYSAINLPPMKQGQRSPKPQKPGYTDNDFATSTLNYVTLDFKKQNEAKRAPEDSTVYAMVSKNKQSNNSQSEHNDYENVSSACASRLPVNNIDWESDTSEEDEVNYTTVSCSAKPAVKEPKHNQRRHFGSSSSDDEERTEYSAIKT